MKNLRLKGSRLQIKINVKISIKSEEPTINYFLERDKIDFQRITEFLFQDKNVII